MKIWAYIILATILIGGVGAGWNAAHSSGYNKRDAEIRADAIWAQNEAIEKGIAAWVKTIGQAEAVIIIEEVIVEKIREVEKRIPYAVEKIVEIAPDCADLGDDYARVLNDQINASNSRQAPSTDVAPGVVTEMP